MMAIDERTRHALHQRLDEVLGADEAATLMAHLPPTGWSDVVTRDYLDTVIQAQDVRMDARFTRLESRIDAVRHELLAATRGELVAALAQQTRQMIVAMIGTVLSLATLARFI
jgi:hypothetical protein